MRTHDPAPWYGPQYPRGGRCARQRGGKPMQRSDDQRGYRRL